MRFLRSNGNSNKKPINYRGKVGIAHCPMNQFSRIRISRAIYNVEAT